MNRVWRARLIASLAVAIVWAFLLGILAHGHAPWHAQGGESERVASPEQWLPAAGKLRADDHAVIEDFDPSGAALMIWRPEPFEASELPVLRLRMDDFPFNYVLMLAWTPAGGEPAFTRLQVPLGSMQTYHLGRFDRWQGEIVEFALYMHPHQQNLPPQPVEHDPVLRTFALVEDSMGHRLAALLTSWFGADPWEMLSVSSLGAQRDLDEGVRLLPVLAGLWLTGFGIWWLCMRAFHPGALRWHEYMLRGAFIAMTLSWLVFMASVGKQHVATRAQFAGLSHSEKQSLVFDEELVKIVEEARAVLPAPPEPRIFIVTDDRFISLRAAWHLRPHNVMTILRRNPGIRDGDYVFYYRRPDLDRQVAVRAMQVRDQEIRVRRLSGGRDGTGLVQVTAGGVE